MKYQQWDPSKFTGPCGYRCSACHQRGVKLWRILPHRMDDEPLMIELWCAVCVLIDADETCEVDENGVFHTGSEFDDDVLSGGDWFFIPAIPTGMRSSRWYFPIKQAPEEFVAWWRRLPTDASFYTPKAA